ncbi:hypothetical protein D3C76_1433590 [compost metagenome]
MSTFAFDLNVKIVRRRHHRSCFTGNYTYRQRGPQMNAIYDIHAFKRTIRNDLNCTARQQFFCRLEQKANLSLNLLLVTAEIQCRTEQD